MATQIGSGSFAAATLADNSLTLSIPEGTTNFAVAYVCPGYSDGNYQVTEEIVVEASTLDGTSYSESCSTTSSPGATGTLTGNVDASAISGVNEIGILAQDGTPQAADFLAASGGSFSFAAPTGNDRVEVATFDDYGSLSALKNFSSQSVPGALNDGNTIILSTADMTVQEPITYENVPAGFYAPYTNPIIRWSGGTDGLYLANAVASSYPALPAGAKESGDFYEFQAVSEGTNPGLTNGDEEVYVYETTTSGGAQTFSFPPVWSYAGPAAATWPSFDFAYSGFSSGNVCKNASLIWYPNRTTLNEYGVFASETYLAGSNTVEIPDLTGVSGFIAAPASSTSVTWLAEIDNLTSPCFQNSSSLNSTEKGVFTGGTYTAP
ncbi:MAG: hypothetical protein WB424_03100 [Terracidiphilus sp.]